MNIDLILKKWMQMDCSESMLLMLLKLDDIHCRAVSVFLQSVILVKNHGGVMDLSGLLRRFTTRHLSRKTVVEILEASGYFVIDEYDIAFSEQTVALFGANQNARKPMGADAPDNSEKKEDITPVTIEHKGDSPAVSIEQGGDSPAVTIEQGGIFPAVTPEQGGIFPAVTPEQGGNFPSVTPEQGGNFPAVIPANVRASSCTIQEKRIEEKREKENVTSFFARGESQEVEERSWPAVPEEMQQYRMEDWYNPVCELFDRSKTERWRDTLMMQTYDKELVGLAERNWAATVLQFVRHLVTWPSSRPLCTINDVKRCFSGFFRPDRAPSRDLKTYLRQLDLSRQSIDDRQRRFYNYMQKHCPHLMQMERALTCEQFDQLRQRYGKVPVLRVLDAMENTANLPKRDCFRTAEEWLFSRSRAKGLAHGGNGV